MQKKTEIRRLIEKGFRFCPLYSTPGGALYLFSSESENKTILKCRIGTHIIDQPFALKRWLGRDNSFAGLIGGDNPMIYPWYIISTVKGIYKISFWVFVFNNISERDPVKFMEWVDSASKNDMDLVSIEAALDMGGGGVYYSER